MAHNCLETAVSSLHQRPSSREHCAHPWASPNPQGGFDRSLQHESLLRRQAANGRCGDPQSRSHQAVLHDMMPAPATTSHPLHGAVDMPQAPPRSAMLCSPMGGTVYTKSPSSTCLGSLLQGGEGNTRPGQQQLPHKGRCAAGRRGSTGRRAQNSREAQAGACGWPGREELLRRRARPERRGPAVVPAPAPTSPTGPTPGSLQPRHGGTRRPSAPEIFLPCSPPHTTQVHTSRCSSFAARCPFCSGAIVRTTLPSVHLRAAVRTLAATHPPPPLPRPPPARTPSRVCCCAV